MDGLENCQVCELFALSYTHYFHYCWYNFLPSVLWCCWLSRRKGIWPVKPKWWDAGIVISLGWGADLHMTQLMPLPLTISCCSKSTLVFPFWYRLTPGSPGQSPGDRKTVVEVVVVVDIILKASCKCKHVDLYCCCFSDVISTITSNDSDKSDKTLIDVSNYHSTLHRLCSLHLLCAGTSSLAVFLYFFGSSYELMIPYYGCYKCDSWNISWNIVSVRVTHFNALKQCTHWELICGPISKRYELASSGTSIDECQHDTWWMPAVLTLIQAGISVSSVLWLCWALGRVSGL